MDLFDDDIDIAPAARARPSAKKFAPKVKSKQSLPKEISADDGKKKKNMHVASSKSNLNNDNRSLAGVIPSQSDLVNAVPSEAVVCNGTAAFCKSTAEDANERKKSLRKRKRSSVAGVEDYGGKNSRQLRKQAACEHVKNSNSSIEDDDELDPPYNNIDQLEENDDEDEVDYSSKKKRASSKKKCVAKNRKAYKKRKKENGDSEKTTKEPPKKFSHSSWRRKRHVDQAVLDDYEFGFQSMSMRNILAAANKLERLKEKEAKSSTNPSGGDFFHDAGANNEEETFSSDDDGFRDQEDDQASEKFTSTVPLYNYQSFMRKSPRAKWSKQDTEQFYEALKEFGLDFDTIKRVVFPGKTKRQILLKYKNEDRHHPLRITDAINSRSTDHHLSKSVIAKLQQNSTTNANQEATEDMSPGINEEVGTTKHDIVQEEVATTKQDIADVEDQEDPVAYHSLEQFDDSDDDIDIREWFQYQSNI